MCQSSQVLQGEKSPRTNLSQLITKGNNSRVVFLLIVCYIHITKNSSRVFTRTFTIIDQTGGLGNYFVQGLLGEFRPDSLQHSSQFFIVLLQIIWKEAQQCHTERSVAQVLS